MRQSFKNGSIIHTVRREHIYQDVLKLYATESIANHYPLKIQFEGERAVDCGGVCRDMITGFWEKAYEILFDGSTLLTPLLHPQLDTTILPVVGRILSHGFFVCGFLPVRIAFPTLAMMLKGPTTAVSDDVILEAFPDSVSNYDATILRKALISEVFEEPFQDKLLNVLSKFGCRQLPSPGNIRKIFLQIGRFEFLIKPLHAVMSIQEGVGHRDFGLLSR